MSEPLTHHRRSRFPRLIFVLVTVGLISLLEMFTSVRCEDFQESTHMLEFEKPPINYSKAEPADPVSVVAKALRANRAAGWKSYDPKFGYLPAVLEVLGVPVTSQMLVFSKTSLQRNNINPSNPRALYFSDDVYVGFIPGAPEIEIAAVDPNVGTTFYTVNQDKDEPLRFRRTNDCLRCHASARSMGVPGFVLRSLNTQPSGEIDSSSETEKMSHCTPISQRWGGWYVTNAPADWVHRGNSPGKPTKDAGALKGLLNRVTASTNYPATGSSALPLLVHDHQTHMHNYITRLHMEGLQRIADYGQVKYLDNQIRAFLRYLLFTEEARLPSPVEASQDFILDFQKNAKRDSKGRSLKDMDLQTRLFRYPCSFLIDSDAFRKLPDPLRRLIMERLHMVLTGADTHLDFAAIPSKDRQAVLEILRETAPDLTVGW